MSTLSDTALHAAGQTPGRGPADAAPSSRPRRTGAEASGAEASVARSPALSVRNLHVTFGHAGAEVHAVRGISFDLALGECVALVGESGSGKSVTARAILGLVGQGSSVSAAELRWGDDDLLTLSPQRWRQIRGRHIALVLQDALSSLDPLRRVGAEIAEPLEVHRMLPRTGIRDRVRQLLTLVGVPQPQQRARQYPHELSGGLRQRALIASAIAGNPELIIADEPTTALDVTVQAQILELLAELRTRGAGLLLISHDLAVVAQLADRVIVMRNGQLVEQGPTVQVLTEPREEYTQALIAAIPSVSKRPARSAPDEEPSTVLELRGVGKSYPTPGGGARAAVSGATVTLRAGEILGVVGESGSGKTTLGRIILGLTQPDTGSVQLLGESWSTARESERRGRRLRIQAISQDPLGSFDPRHTVGAILGEALSRAGVSRGERAAASVALLNQVGLDAEHRARRPQKLSGGQRQRVAIARALATKPEIIVCDEAVSALDVSIQAQVLALISELRATTGVAFVFISHDLGVVQHIADRVLVMKDGHIVESGPVDAVFDNPQHDYTRALLAAVPTLPTAPITPSRKD